MKHKLNPQALGQSIGLLSALTMLAMTLGYYLLGAYPGAVASMQSIHMFYTITFFGTIAGMIEAGIMGYIGGWLIAFFYNKFDNVL